MKRSPRWLLPVALAATAAVTMTACSTGSAGSSSGQAAATATANVAADGALSGKKVLYIDAAPGNALLDGLAQGLAIDLAAQGADVARVFLLNAQKQIDLAAGSERII